MSDYLGHLIARTVSPDAVVRPQLPSLFEPLPGNRPTQLEPGFERKLLSEQPPISPRTQEPSPTPLENPASRHSVRHELKAVIPEMSRAKRNVRTNEEPDPVREEIIPSSAFKRSEKEPAVDWAEISLEPVMPKSRKNDLPEQRLEVDLRRARSEEEIISSSRLSVPSFQPKSERLLTSAPTITKDRPVHPVVPSVRALPPVQLARTPAPGPTINVTIGRVEIRATSPPPAQRACAKSGNVLSLEDYLRQRSSGGGR